MGAGGCLKGPEAYMIPFKQIKAHLRAFMIYFIFLLIKSKAASLVESKNKNIELEKGSVSPL